MAARGESRCWSRRTTSWTGGEPGRATRYGINGIAANTGWVSVGTDHDTAAFAVASIRRWWQAVGRHGYPRAARLLITADAGGSNGYRTRAWNKVEHRLFSHISMNWRVRPLTSHEAIVNSIAATTTRTGLRVHAELDPGTYDTGVKVTDDEIDALPMSRHRFHGDWNCTLHPIGLQTADGREEEPQAAAVITTEQPRHPNGLNASVLRDPELASMAIEQLDALAGSLIPAPAHQRERLRHERRGGERLRARGAGAKDKLPDADRVPAAVLCLRKIGTRALPARLFGVAGSTLTRAVQEVRPLLAEHAIPPPTARFRTPTDVATHLDAYGSQTPRKIKPAC